MHSEIEILSSKIYAELASFFPIACTSDEFFYFPQAKVPDSKWDVWDRFSTDIVSEVVKKLSSWETELDSLLMGIPSCSSGEDMKIRLLKQVVRTLGEQLSMIRTWETQPSFYLTITCAGLSEALGTGRAEASHRARTLPDFLDQAVRNFKEVPKLYRDLGMEMIPGVREYLISLLPQLPELKSSLAALDRFEACLSHLKVRKGPVLAEDKLARVIDTHINTGMDIREVNDVLDLEIEAMTRGLEKEARKIGFSDWLAGYDSIPLPKTGSQGLTGMYRDQVESLGRFCVSSGLVDEALFQGNSVRVMPVPGYLSAIRAASAYSILPGHPPSGGVFYVINANDPAEAQKNYHREYRILSAHETWPGHHLLDISRWSLQSPLLRPVEQPIFYEGWACFAEEFLWLTGYLSDSRDRIMLLKRRLWRAVRGKADLGLRSGTMNMGEAVQDLIRTGMTPDQAWSSVRKYSLNPGYQLCYTLGLRTFLDLFHGYGENHPDRFVRRVLSRGEISFKALERSFKHPHPLNHDAKP